MKKRSPEQLHHDIETIRVMISIYCKSKHHSKEFCTLCNELLTYATQRLTSCKYGDSKPTCRNCTTHCYKPAMKEEIKKVMRFSGPRMIIYHPLLALKHIFQSLR